MKLLLSLAALSLGTAAHAQTVNVDGGRLEGVTQGSVTAFKGIPYAAAPVGDLRWRAPQPAPHWQGIRDAGKFGADCAQVKSPFGDSGNPAGMSEDCLFINVWRPAEIAPQRKLPVMVWIHGGAFVFGSGAHPSTSGEQFAKQGVILVSLNYRLGRFGFFAFPSLNNEHANEPGGNYALLDQVAALKWVRQNIAAFGGDPANVTIFGESAGGVALHNLLTMPMARGLFHKAIIESGGGRDGTLTARPMQSDGADRNYPVSALTIGRNFAARYGIMGEDHQALAKLRAQTLEQIIDGGQETAGPNGPRTYSGPMLDGRVIVETAETAYRAGRQAKVPLMIGSNSAEVPAGFVAATTKAELFDGFGKGKAKAIAAYDPDGTKPLATLLSQVNTDRVWAEPARLTANAFVARGAPAYVYRFSYVASSLAAAMPLGAPHASEIDYVFDTVKTRYGAALTSRDQAVASQMNRYWANFAKTGTPNGPGLAAWPRHNATTNPILDFQADGSALGGPNAHKARLDANTAAGGPVIAR